MTTGSDEATQRRSDEGTESRCPTLQRIRSLLFRVGAESRIAPLLPRCLAASLCFAGVFSAGCVTKAPEVRLIGVSVPQVTDEAARLELALELVNTSDKPLELLEFTYMLESRGQTLYTGRWSAQATLAAQSTRMMSIPAVISNSAADNGAQAEPDQVVEDTSAAGQWPDVVVSPIMVKGRVGFTEPGKIPELLRDLRVFRPAAEFEGPVDVNLAGRE